MCINLKLFYSPVLKLQLCPSWDETNVTASYFARNLPRIFNVDWYNLLAPHHINHFTKNPQEAVDLVTSTEEILNGKLHFCAVQRTLNQIHLVKINSVLETTLKQSWIWVDTFNSNCVDKLKWFWPYRKQS